MIIKLDKKLTCSEKEVTKLFIVVSVNVTANGQPFHVYVIVCVVYFNIFGAKKVEKA